MLCWFLVLYFPDVRSSSDSHICSVLIHRPTPSSIPKVVESIFWGFHFPLWTVALFQPCIHAALISLCATAASFLTINFFPLLLVMVIWTPILSATDYIKGTNINVTYATSLFIFPPLPRAGCHITSVTGGGTSSMKACTRLFVIHRNSVIKTTTSRLQCL